ncbi:hypothetical protein GCM10023093_12180 [Nemorincola caseinilytica]|uniref:DUF983 domain-containing protein n=1 Tax=Nemorincola caseinilytica TaxID=2054315 RepID=A0ABP8NDA1_9BACT
MCAQKEGNAPGLLWSVLTNKCPRCRKGHLFTYKNPYKWGKTVAMPENCPVCGQKYELETGFYFGTGYVSYGLTIMFTALTFVLWWLILGISLQDNSILWWLAANAAIIMAMQPILQRWSRSMWIAFFVRYDKGTLLKSN